MQLQSALPIVRALADGINPLTGETFNDESPYSEPRTLRALFSAVELMEREVEREKRRERLVFFLRPRLAEVGGQALATGYDAGLALLEIARKHARTVSSIRLRLEKLGKIEPQPAA